MDHLKNTCVSYDDVLLIPQYSDIRSRSEIDISTEIGNGLNLNIPIIASPMDTISEGVMGAAMAAAGGTAVIHRYNTIEEQARHVAAAKEDTEALEASLVILFTLWPGMLPLWTE